jgi:glucose-6-phosphate 1-epimerase
MNLETLRQFEIPGVAEIAPGNGGLPKVRVTHAHAKGEIYLHGAHVTSWKPRGAEEVLYVSPRARWETGRAIRGGVPICFPWFGANAGDPSAPAHGFVRLKAWQLQSIRQVSGSVCVSMFTEDDEGTQKWWPAGFRLLHRVTFGAELTMELILTNAGATSLRFEEALHTYLAVGQVQSVRVQGLDEVHYLDEADQKQEKTQQGDVVIAAETDRLYLNTAHEVEINDPVMSRRVRIAKENSMTTVVWNPWTEKARKLTDLGEEEWPHMLCVETCNVGDFAVSLAPGQQHAMKATISVTPL